jgi:hypothetical protein
MENNSDKYNECENTFNWVLFFTPLFFVIVGFILGVSVEW